MRSYDDGYTWDVSTPTPFSPRTAWLWLQTAHFTTSGLGRREKRDRGQVLIEIRSTAPKTKVKPGNITLTVVMGRLLA